MVRHTRGRRGSCVSKTPCRDCTLAAWAGKAPARFQVGFGACCGVLSRVPRRGRNPSGAGTCAQASVSCRCPMKANAPCCIRIGDTGRRARSCRCTLVCATGGQRPTLTLKPAPFPCQCCVCAANVQPQRRLGGVTPLPRSVSPRGCAVGRGAAAGISVGSGGLQRRHRRRATKVSAAGITAVPPAAARRPRRAHRTERRGTCHGVARATVARTRAECGVTAACCVGHVVS